MLTDQDIKKLTEAQKGIFATKADLSAMETLMSTKQDLADLEDRVVGKFSDLQMSVDRYLKFTETWHQELRILKGRQDRLAEVLVNKGVVTERRKSRFLGR